MSTYNIGVIGTGEEHGGTAESGSAMGYRHASAYETIDECDLVACADIVRENAKNFAATFGIDDANAFQDHRTMVRKVDLDVISITTPIPTHADIVIDCVRDGDPQAIHCEKPMANTWGESKLMLQECARHDVQLTFNHQLRLSEPAQRAKELLDDDAIGSLVRVEAARGDLLEAGTHQMDLCSYFADDVPAKWILGSVDYRDENTRNGVHIEDQTLGLWEYENGVHGLVSTGDGIEAIECHNRLVGTDGIIEIAFWGEEQLRVQREGEWEFIDCSVADPLSDAIEHAVECIGTNSKPLLSAQNALIGTELIFGLYESVRRRGRVDLPLSVEDNPLQSLLDAGELQLT